MMPTSIRVLALAFGLAACGGSGAVNSTAQRIFVTSGQFGSDLGGLSGADAHCNTAAEAASLSGSWVAWLSSTTDDAIDRVTGAGPWYLVDRKTKVFNNRANLMTTPLVGIATDEQGQPANPQDWVWTGTAVGGAKDCDTMSCECADWSAQTTSFVSTGQVGASDSQWTQRMPTQLCNFNLHLYCLEQQ
jgi:hypothetical protein